MTRQPPLDLSSVAELLAELELNVYYSLDVISHTLESYARRPLPDISDAEHEAIIFHGIEQNGDFKLRWSRVHPDGNPVTYTEMFGHVATLVRYLSVRYDHTQRAQLKAQYARVLAELEVDSRERQRNFKAAAQNYHLWAKQLLEQLPQEGSLEQTVELLNALRSAFHLAKRFAMRAELDQVIATLEQVPNNVDVQHDHHHFALRQWVDFVAEQKDLKPQLETAVDLLRTMADLYEGRSGPGYRESFRLTLERASTLEGRLNRASKPRWAERLARSYRRQMDQDAQNQSWDDYLMNNRLALRYFQQAGLTVEVDALHRSFDEHLHRFNLRWTPHRVPFDVGSIEALEQQLCGLTPGEFLRTVASLPDLLPDLVELEREQQGYVGMPFYRIPVVLYNAYGQVIQTFSTEPELEGYHRLQGFATRYRTLTLPVLVKCFSGFFEQNAELEPWRQVLSESWMARPYEVPYAHGGTNSVCWLDLLWPALSYFLGQFPTQASVQPDYSVLVDVVSLKLEGLVRRLAQLQGISIFKVLRDSEVVQAKNLQELLAEPALGPVLGETNILLLRYLFVEHLGPELRHKVAHGLATDGDYSVEAACGVLLVLLRLSRVRGFAGLVQGADLSAQRITNPI